MFGYNPLNPFGAFPGAMASAMPGLAAMAASRGPGGPMNDAGPSTIRVTDPSRYGQAPFADLSRPSPAPSPSGIAAAASPNPTAAGNSSGMFAAQPKHNKIDWGTVAGTLAQAYLGYEAGMGVRGAAEQLQGVREAMLYRRKKQDTDADTAKYVQALVAQGLSPDQATIMAADPAEMAKHFGTHYDQKVLNQGDTLATPNLNGTMQTYTAPDIQRNGADIVQSPGLQGVTAPFSSLSVGGPPQQIGDPLSINGLRTDAEQYAAATGAQPGTPGYLKAVQDYTLKDHGPTAFGFNQTLQNARLSNAANIAHGHDLTSAANNTRSTSTSAANNLRSTGQSNVNNLRSTQTSAANNATSNQTRLQTSRRIRPLPNEPVAHNAQGHLLVVRNGAWVDTVTGQPVR